MIVISLYLLSAIFLGLIATHFFLEDLWECLIFGGILAITLVAALNFSLALLFTLPIATYLTFAIVLTAIVLIFLFTKKREFRIYDFLKNKFMFFVVFFWGGVFLYLLHQTHLYQNGQGFFGSPSTYGDLPFHLSLITNFAYGENFPPVNPSAPFNHLSYHFFVDFLSGVFLNLTNDYLISLIIPSLVLGILTAGSLALLTFRITKSALAANLTPALFFLNGGVGFVDFFQKIQSQGLNLTLTTTARYAHIPNLGIDFPNIITELMMAERALLLGIPLAVTSLFFLSFWNETKKRRFLLLAAVAAGFLPYANIYGFITVGLISTFLCLVNLINYPTRKLLSCWLLFDLIVFAIISPFVFWTSGQILSKEHFLSVTFFGWPPMTQTQKIWFWITNFGLVPLMAIWIFLKGINNPKYLVINILLLITILAHFILFQPYAWDNNRFVLYPFIAMSILAAIFLTKFIQSRKITFKIAGIFLILISIAQGVLVTIYDPQIHYQLYSEQDFQIAQFIRQNTPPNSIFLTSRNHNNLVPTLAGRKIVLGYGGFLWTQGINDPPDIINAMNTIYSGNDVNKFLVKKYGINYIFISSWERANFSNLSQDKLLKKYPTIYNDGGTIILKAS